MTFHCEECGNLLESGYPCDRCHHDPTFGKSDGFAFDGGHVLEDSLEGHLEAALDAAETSETRYHIRAALQHNALLEGEVGWRGTYGPANGGVTD